MNKTFESTIRQIAHPQTAVYTALADPRNLSKISDKIPEEQRKGLSFDADHLAIHVPGAGEIKLHIVDREEPKTIKFEAEDSPLPFNFWIQLLPVTAESCKMKLTLKADLNPFVAGMVKKPLQEGIEKIADVLSAINY